MCRIAGIISDKLSAADLVNKTQTMCNALRAGGPDDEGIYQDIANGLALGHRRLAIIDLSAKGHQPMADQQQRVWITFNGEIYNYQHLREELKNSGVTFNSLTDTEVIIQAYIKWGIKSFSKLRGMFAFALYDVANGLAYLVRDSMGIKPLYYYLGNDGISFASEVKALKDAGIANHTDRDWPVRFLAFGHIPEPYTTLQNAFSLPKGHFLRWELHTKNHEIAPYHTTTKQPCTITQYPQAQKFIKNSLAKTVDRQLLSDAPIGVFLSGGIDSSLLTLLANQYKKNDLQTVSIFFNEKEYTEQEYQEIIQAESGVHNHAHLVEAQHFYDCLPQILSDMDMPTTDGINSWFISKYARQEGLKAVLSGIGADELFGGYPSFKRIKYIRYLKLIPSPLLKLIALLGKGRLKRFELLTYNHPLADYLFLRGLFTPAIIAKVLNCSKKQIAAILFGPSLSLDKQTIQEKASWFETNLYMQNQLLRDTDVMSMAHGLEVRVPFLDEDFVNIVNQIKPDIRFKNRPAKKLLIDSFKELLPGRVWKRPKMGFSFPLQKWMRTHQEIGQTGFYHTKHARKITRRFRKNKEHWSKAFALYQLQKQGFITEKKSAKKILLLTLETFCAIGGIQKMSRTMGLALQQIAAKHHLNFKLWSVYDKSEHANNDYIDTTNFKGFNKNKLSFSMRAIFKSKKTDVLILTHINLALIGCLSKIIKPKVKIWLIAHGIEVWRPLGFFKKLILKKCDEIICVSNFTRQKLIDIHQVDAAKCMVLNNALDPLIKLPETFSKPDYLLERYKLSSKHKIIFTLSRLASTEQYKGYEQVIKVISNIKTQIPGIKYILAGKYDDVEYNRITQLITEYSVQDQVILTGFIPEDELEDHFLLADLFVLPSRKEGFGIVFIEAMACGLPVICGNEDGSLDAIKNGELGQAVNVDDLVALEAAMLQVLNSALDINYKRNLQNKCISYFSAANYKKALETLLIDGYNY